MPQSRLARFVIWFLIACLAIIAFGVLFYFLIARTQVENLSERQRQSSQLKIVDGQALVPQRRVPRSLDQLEEAPAIALVPTNWEEDPDNISGAGPETDPANITSAERGQIEETVERFLKRWETFGVGDNQDLRGTEQQRKYRDDIFKLTTPGGFEDVASRAESKQTERVCPTCEVGSQMTFFDPKEAMTVRMYDNQSAFVTASATVTYLAGDPGDRLHRTRWLRSYGIVLEKQDGQWKVKRVSAATATDLPSPG